MPSTRPRASFEPISPDFDINALVESTPNFNFVDRISCDMIDVHGIDKFDRLVLLHVVIGGKPLVIDGYQNKLDPWTFSSRWLQDNYGETKERARDLTSQNFIDLTVGHYLRSMGPLADQYFSKKENFKDKNRQRVYLKDIDCPPVWRDKVQEQLPPNVFYLNECTAAVGGPGSSDEPNPHGGKRKGKGIGPAGDLMSSLPENMRADNLMCYIGHEGTYTPAHREMCASLGHNIMVECSEGLGDDGKAEHPGSSIWFMTETKDRHSVAEYWLSKLGHDVEVEKHFAQIAAWKRAPFPVYVVDQRPGDFILIPPLAPHQVWNRGTRTMKVAWNRTTVETLELALTEALPNSRIVCRDEQYKNKAIVLFTLQKYSALLTKLQDLIQTAPRPEEVVALRNNSRIKALRKDFKRLMKMFVTILLSEAFKPGSEERGVQYEGFEQTVTCSYCRGNIFNRFLSCSSCEFFFNSEIAEPYDICMECYAMGRSCGCISKLKWVEQFKWRELTTSYERWRKQYIQIDGKEKDDTPKPFLEELANMGKKTLAQVCQEQLKKRPWKDVMNPPALEAEESEEEEVDENGLVKKKSKKKTEAWFKNHWSCHFCCHRHEKWKMAECSGCGRRYCYGTLFRGHDLMPQGVMEAIEWKCPHCLGCCSAGGCRKNPNQTPHQPKGTLLGHNTKAVADPRSVESLVDFSVSNLHFLNETSRAPASEARLHQRQQEADAAKENEDPVDPYASEDEIAMEDTQIDGVPTASQAGNGWTAANSQIDPAILADTVTDPATPYHMAADDDNAASDEDQMAAILQHGVVPQPQKRAAPSSIDKSETNAMRQYRKQQEKLALEVARKEGHYIKASAALKGQSKVIKLTIASDVLRQALRRNLKEQAQAALNGIGSQTKPSPAQRSIISSDIPPPTAPLATKAAAAQKHKQVRVRAEKDEDFSTRKRYRKVGASTSGPKGPGKNFVDLDLSDEDDEHSLVNNQSGLENNNGSKRRRISAWQAQHQGADDENIPDELPDNFRSRTRNRNKSRNPNAAKFKPSFAVPVTSMQPAPAPVDASGKNHENGENHMNGANDDNDDKDTADDIPPNNNAPFTPSPEQPARTFAQVLTRPFFKAANKMPAIRPFTGGKSTAQIRPPGIDASRGTVEPASSDPSDSEESDGERQTGGAGEVEAMLT